MLLEVGGPQKHPHTHTYHLYSHICVYTYVCVYHNVFIPLVRRNRVLKFL